MKVSDRIKQTVSTRILGLQPYKVESSDNLLKLDAMENPYELSEDLRKKWAALLINVDINRYPDPTCRELRERLSQSKSLDSSIDMIFGNGSDELINLLCLIFSGKIGGSILFPEPTFTVYRLSAESHGLDSIGVPLRADDFSFELDHMLAVIKEKQPSLIFLASPNNPTGNSLNEQSIIQLCNASDGLVVLDEAYYKFSKVSHIKLLNSVDNLVIMQTFSKIGFAGIRLGVLFGSRDWIQLLDRVRMPYNVNSLTQVAGIFALDYFEEIQQGIDNIVLERGKMLEFLDSLDSVKVWPSDANFILFRPLLVTAEQVYDGLRERGILIKNLSGGYPALQNCLRVTIGKEEENALFREKLVEITEKGSP